MILRKFPTLIERTEVESNMEHDFDLDPGPPDAPEPDDNLDLEGEEVE